MYILDALIIIGFIIGILNGFRRGVIKSTVLLGGLIICVILSYYLKNPVSTFMYKVLPFFTLNNDAKIINIIIYEIIAFTIIFCILYLMLRIILKISGLIEKLLNITVILGIISKLLGSIIGFIEAYIIIFILLFFLSQPFMNITKEEGSTLKNKILYSSPVLTKSVKDIDNAIKEVTIIYEKDNKNKHKEAIDVFLKYSIISNKNLNILIKKGKVIY